MPSTMLSGVSAPAIGSEAAIMAVRYQLARRRARLAAARSPCGGSLLAPARCERGLDEAGGGHPATVLGRERERERVAITR